MATSTVQSLQQNCRGLQMCVRLCAGQSLSFTTHPERVEGLLRNSYLQIVSGLKNRAPEMNDAVVRINPAEKTSFIFTRLQEAKDLGSQRDILRFALGTTEWGYQGMVEIDSTGAVHSVSWQYYAPQSVGANSFGPYRYTAEGLSTGGFCKRDTVGSGIVLLPFLLSGGIQEVAVQSPEQLGVKFLESRFRYEQILPSS